eukprot:TRINITY_DN1537_c0_g1_i2.p3 TRINITY_DN1537_c0_g1~~TRINITY_DN1537_c0_g1_i2.p3  ORF type:complete len:112 (-),score=26.27 TRINITY_DN1537_c0_g1_i2:136-471(-)
MHVLRPAVHARVTTTNTRAAMRWYQIISLVAIGFAVAQLHLVGRAADAVLQVPFMSNKVTVLVVMLVMAAVYFFAIFLPLYRVAQFETEHTKYNRNAPLPREKLRRFRGSF